MKKGQRVAFILATLLTMLLVGAVTTKAQQTPDPRVADIVKAGKLRVGVGLGAAATAIKDPKSGELRGPAVDLARALAARIGVELQLVEYPRPGAVMEGVRTNAWDVTFLVSEPTRATEVDFTTPYMQSDYSFLVLADSPIRNFADVDRPGVRIATPRGDSSDIHVSRLLKQAEMVRTDSFAAGLELLRTRQVDAFTASRVNLIADAAQIPGSRVLEDGLDVLYFTAFIPKGHAGRLAYVSEFIEQAKASGLVKQAIERAGLRGVKVAEPSPSMPAR